MPASWCASDDLMMSAGLAYLWHVPGGPYWDRVKAWAAVRLVQKKNLAGRTITVKAGVRMHIDPHEFIGREIFLTGEWQSDVCRVLQRHLRAGQSFVDVGANAGYISLMASRILGRRGRVLALEPNPVTYARLRANLELNDIGNVTTLQVAAAAAKGEMTLSDFDPANSGASSLRKPGNQDGQQVKSSVVPVERLDAIVEQAGLSCPSVIKIDVEGAEAAVIEGATELLKQPDLKSIVCEVSEWSLEQMGSSAAELIGRLKSFGFECHPINRPTISKFSPMRSHRQYDAIFLR